MRRADKQVGWGPDGWKAAALAAFIVPGASAAWSWAAPIGLELSRRSNIRGSTYFPLQGAGWSGLQSTQTHISGVWVQGHEWQAGRRHCGQRGLIVKAQITSNVLVRAPPLHIWPKMSRHMKGDLYEGHQFSVTMKESARQGHHLHITRSKKTPATSSPPCFSRAP